MSDLAARFARETGEHRMTVLHADGLYRHLRFQHQEWRPPLLHPQKSSFYWFDLITVPGALIFRGDGDSFVFARVEDMFEFFRGPVGRINPHYWAEKLTSDRDSVMTYSRALFEQHVNETVAEAIENGAPAALADAVRTEVLEPEEYDTEYEVNARQVLDDFKFWTDEDDRYRKRPEFQFSDTWEWQLRDYDWWFLWALHGIVWGIAQYDAHNGSAGQPSRAPEPAHSASTARVQTKQPVGGVL